MPRARPAPAPRQWVRWARTNGSGRDLIILAADTSVESARRLHKIIGNDVRYFRVRITELIPPRRQRAASTGD